MEKLLKNQEPHHVLFLNICKLKRVEVLLVELLWSIFTTSFDHVVLIFSITSSIALKLAHAVLKVLNKTRWGGQQWHNPEQVWWNLMPQKCGETSWMTVELCLQLGKWLHWNMAMPPLPYCADMCRQCKWCHQVKMGGPISPSLLSSMGGCEDVFSICIYASGFNNLSSLFYCAGHLLK